MPVVTPIDEFLRQRFRALRKACALTQEQVAEASGFSVIYYQSVEAGRRTNLPVRTIERLAQVFGLSVHELFAEEIPKIKVGKVPSKPAHYRWRKTASLSTKK